MNADDFGKVLAEEQLKQSFDKYLVIGFSAKNGGEYFSNCDAEQLALMLRLFSEIYKSNE